MDFYNSYSQGFVRVAACTHHTTLGDPAANAASVLRLAGECHDEGVGLAVFPELTLSGYSIEDIVLQDLLLDDVEAALADVVAASTDLLPVLVVGAPLRYEGQTVYVIPPTRTTFVNAGFKAAVDGLRRFRLELEGAPPGVKYEGALINLTAVTDGDAIEVPIHLD